MSVYAIAICDICGNEKRSPVNHVSDRAYWERDNGRRPVGWQYHMAHSGDSAASVLFCDKCEKQLADSNATKVKEMIANTVVNSRISR